MNRRVSILIALAALAFPAGAQAATIHDDLEAAHRYWQTGAAVPEPADAQGVCRGRWNVIADPTLLRERGIRGAATGIGSRRNPDGGSYTDENGTRWDWYVERCEFTLDPDLQGGARRCLIAHEVGHFILGPSHTGRMAYGAHWDECTAAAYVYDDLQARKAEEARARTPEGRRAIAREMVAGFMANPAGYRIRCRNRGARYVRCAARRDRQPRRFVVEFAPGSVHVAEDPPVRRSRRRS